MKNLEITRTALILQLEQEGYVKIFDRDMWVYYQKGDTLYCLGYEGYERRTILDGGKSPSRIEYLVYIQPED